MSSHRPYTVIDLFGGAGGTGWGFAKAGFKILAAVDNDPNAAETYEKNIRVKVTEADIRTLSPRAWRRELGLRPGELDVLSGCPPCQGFTRLRNAGGAADRRNDLVLRYLRFVTEFKPRFAVFENVPGLLNTEHGRGYHQRLISGFKRRGYKVEQRVLEAADFGVAQRRKRVIIIASQIGFKIRFPEATHGDPDSAAVEAGRIPRWRTVRDVIGRGAFPWLAPGAGNERRGEFPNHVSAHTGPKVCRFLRRVPRNGGSRSDVREQHWLDCHKGHGGHSDTYGRLAWDTQSNTITSGCVNPSKGRFVHPTQNRGLSYREAATLQGFPCDFRFHRSNIERQIGNAVPPPMALAIAKALKVSLKARRNSRKLASSVVPLRMRSKRERRSLARPTSVAA